MRVYLRKRIFISLTPQPQPQPQPQPPLIPQRGKSKNERGAKSSIDFVNLRALAPSWQKTIASLPLCEPCVKPIREFVVNQQNTSPFGRFRGPPQSSTSHNSALFFFRHLNQIKLWLLDCDLHLQAFLFHQNQISGVLLYGLVAIDLYHLLQNFLKAHAP